MTAADQLALFEPSREDAARLVAAYLDAARRHAASADRFDLLQMPGLARVSDAAMLSAVADAQTLSFYVELLEFAQCE